MGSIGVEVEEALGFRVGDLVRISADSFGTDVVAVSVTHVRVRWPYGEPDPASERPWDGTVALPRDPADSAWHRTPHRITPSSDHLQTGDRCTVTTPPVTARLTHILKYDPPEAFGFLPRPEYSFLLVAQDMEHDELAGFSLVFPTDEPVRLDRVR